MVKARIPTARQARPGMLVKQQAIDLGSAAADHRITAVERKGDLNSEYFVITTNQGRWSFYPDEPVTFPRRPDNQKRDWREAATPPLPTDLAIGDLLDGRYGPDLETATEADRERNAQRVTAVTYNRARPNEIVITTFSIEDGPLMTAFLPDEPVRFPRPVRERTSGYDHDSAVLTGYGPYLYVEPDGDEYLYFLITHPGGRGRWPAYTEASIPLGNGAFLSRPPIGKKGRAPTWSSFHFVGTDRWRRHPRDPAWGRDAVTQIEPERLAAAEDAYADYRKRAERAP